MNAPYLLAPVMSMSSWALSDFYYISYAHDTLDIILFIAGRFKSLLTPDAEPPRMGITVVLKQGKQTTMHHCSLVCLHDMKPS
jgi:hypothetical protein